MKNLIREVHKVLPDTAIWLGGPEVSYDARKVLEEHPEVTGVMKGEGEVTFLELAGFYLEGISELAKIEGNYLQGRGSDPGESLERNHGSEYDSVCLQRSEKKFENRIIYYESSRLSVLMQLLSLLDRQETAVPGSGTGQRGITVFPGS